MSNSFVTPWTVACQVPLSLGFPRQTYWNGLLFPSPGDLPNPGIKSVSPGLAGRFFTVRSPGKHRRGSRKCNLAPCPGRRGENGYRWVLILSHLRISWGCGGDAMNESVYVLYPHEWLWSLKLGRKGLEREIEDEIYLKRNCDDPVVTSMAWNLPQNLRALAMTILLRTVLLYDRYP